MNNFSYFTEIEETFVRRRGKNLLLNPIDWALIEDWHDRGLPLHVVIRGIETVFDSFDRAPKPRTIKGLVYCKEEVEAQFTEWSAMQAGRAAADEAMPKVEPGFSVDEIARHINSSVETLTAIKDKDLAEDIGRACSRLEQIKENLNENFELIDSSLSDIEKFLDHALLTNTNKAHLKKIEGDTTAALSEYRASMDDATYKSTFDLMLLKRLREDAGVPRLSLFYL